MYLLEMNHIKKSFDGQGVLKDISLAVAEGEIVSIIGPSDRASPRCFAVRRCWSGWTAASCCTWAKRRPGTALTEPPSMQESENKKEIQGNYGLVFQNFNLFPHYNVLKNIIDAPIHVQKRKSEEVIREAYDLLRKMGLEDKAEAYPLPALRRPVPACCHRKGSP